MLILETYLTYFFQSKTRDPEALNLVFSRSIRDKSVHRFDVRPPARDKIAPVIRYHSIGFKREIEAWKRKPTIQRPHGIAQVALIRPWHIRLPKEFDMVAELVYGASEIPENYFLPASVWVLKIMEW